jgi:4-hydroxy-tetrahydrodipicolinate synthase
MVDLVLQGIMPANVLPFTEDYDIDEVNLRRFVTYLLGVKGVTGLVCNGHAGEVLSLSRSERKAVIRIVVDEVKGRVPVIAGVYHDHTPGAIEHTRDAQDAGADAVLVLPPNAWLRGKHEEAPIHFFEAIADAVDIPMVVFQYAFFSKARYPLPTLLRLAKIKNVVAVKEAVQDWVLYDQEYRALKALPKQVQVLSANNKSLMASFAIGADGAIIGSGSLYPEWVTSMFSAIRENKLDAARSIHQRMQPLTEIMYQEPACDVYTRIKTAQAMMGRLENAVVRPPLLSLHKEEKEKIANALQDCGLLGADRATRRGVA